MFVRAFGEGPPTRVVWRVLAKRREGINDQMRKGERGGGMRDCIEPEPKEAQLRPFPLVNIEMRMRNHIRKSDGRDIPRIIWIFDYRVLECGGRGVDKIGFGFRPRVEMQGAVGAAQNFGKKQEEGIEGEVQDPGRRQSKKFPIGVGGVEDGEPEKQTQQEVG